MSEYIVELKWGALMRVKKVRAKNFREDMLGRTVFMGEEGENVAMFRSDDVITIIKVKECD